MEVYRDLYGVGLPKIGGRVSLFLGGGYHNEDYIGVYAGCM